MQRNQKKIKYKASREKYEDEFKNKYAEYKNKCLGIFDSLSKESDEYKKINDDFDADKSNGLFFILAKKHYQDHLSSLKSKAGDVQGLQNKELSFGLPDKIFHLQKIIPLHFRKKPHVDIVKKLKKLDNESMSSDDKNKNKKIEIEIEITNDLKAINEYLLLFLFDNNSGSNQSLEHLIRAICTLMRNLEKVRQFALLDKAKNQQVIIDYSEYITTYQGLLNDILFLVSENKLPNKDDEDYKIIIYQTMEDSFVNDIKSSVKDSLLKNKLIRSLSNEAFKELNEILTENNENKDVKTILDALINLTNKVYETYNKIESKESSESKEYAHLYKSLVEIRQQIIEKWCLHWDEEKNHSDHFNSVNPYFYFNLSSPTQDGLSREKDKMNLICQQTLSSDFKIIISQFEKEIGSESDNPNRKKLVKKTFKQRIWHSNDQADNGPYGKAAAKTALSEVCKSIENNQLNDKGDINDIFEKALNISKACNEKLIGGGSLKHTLNRIRNVFNYHINIVHCHMFDKYHSYINLINDQEKPSLKDKIYHEIYAAKNDKLWKKTFSNINTYKIKALTTLLKLPSLVIDKELAEIDKILNYNAERMDANTAQSYSDLLNKLSSLILTLRKTKSTVDDLKAKSLEKLCYKIIKTHFLNEGNKHNFFLNFDIDQLNQAINVLRGLLNKQNKKNSLDLQEKLDKKIRLLQSKKMSINRFLIENPEQDIKNDSFNNRSNDFINRHDITSPTRTKAKVDQFKMYFKAKFHALIIGENALASELILPTATNISRAGNVIGAIADKALPGASGVISTVGSVADTFKQQQDATQVIAAIDFDSYAQEILPSLIDKLSNIFIAQINNMASLENVRSFADFCLVRIFDELKKGKKIQKEDLIGFLIKSVFTNVTSLNLIPGRDDHYHQVGDRSTFGHSTFQEMVSSVAMIVKDQNMDDEDKEDADKNPDEEEERYDHIKEENNNDKGKEREDSVKNKDNKDKEKEINNKPPKIYFSHKTIKTVKSKDENQITKYKKLDKYGLIDLSTLSEKESRNLRKVNRVSGKKMISNDNFFVRCNEKNQTAKEFVEDKIQEIASLNKSISNSST